MIKGLFVWLSPYRLLNVIFDRKPDLFAAYVRITRVSIIARRLLAPEAWKSLGPIRVQTLTSSRIALRSVSKIAAVSPAIDSWLT